MNNIILIIREIIKKFILFFLLKLNLGTTNIIFKLEKSDKYFDKINNSFLKALSGKTNLPNWILQMDGMSGIKFRSFLNFIFEDNKNNTLNYLEIGSWRGSTLCSALYNNNLSAKCIDNFSQFRGMKFKLLANAKRACKNSSQSKFELIDLDFYKIDFSKLGKFDVYFYDGSSLTKKSL